MMFVYTVYNEKRKLGMIEALDNGLWRATTKVGTGIFPNKTRALDALSLKDDYSVIRIEATH